MISPTKVTIITGAFMLASLSISGMPQPQLAHAADRGQTTMILREGSAWKSLGNGVYASAAPGTVFKAGDSIWAGQGAYLTVGPSSENIVMLKGEIKIAESDPATRLDLKRGRVYAALDNWRGGAFEIRTPQSIAAVRGTVFSVSQSTQATEVANYRGEVQVYARRPSDGAAMQSRVLEAGQKSAVLAEPRRLEAAETFDAMDLQEWSGLSEALKALRRKLKRKKTTAFSIETTQTESAESGGLVINETEEKKVRPGRILF